jgi:hypothetical protein
MLAFELGFACPPARTRFRYDASVRYEASVGAAEAHLAGADTFDAEASLMDEAMMV